MIYIVVFAISCMLLWAAESPYIQRYKPLWVTVVLLGISVPALLAGLRDSSIGTDVELYGNLWFGYAHSFDFFEYIEFAQSCDIGVGYALLNYIVGLFTEDERVFYFMLSFVEILLIYIGARGFKEQISVPFAMFCYYTIFYNNTLNLLRQCLAISVVFVAYRFLVKEKYLVTMLILIASVLCHTSAIITFVIPIIYLILKRMDAKLSVYTFNLVGFVGLAGIMFLYQPIVNAIVRMGILSSRFNTYAGTSIVGGRLIRTGFCLIVALFGYIAFSKMINFYRENKFIISCLTMSLAFSLVMFMGNIFAIRMAYYFDVAAIVFIPMVPKIYKAKIGKIEIRYVVYVLLIILLIVRWYLEYVRSGNGETYPYKFAEL